MARDPRTLPPRERAAHALALIRGLAEGKAMPQDPRPLTPEAEHARRQDLRAGLAEPEGEDA